MLLAVSASDPSHVRQLLAGEDATKEALTENPQIKEP